MELSCLSVRHHPRCRERNFFPESHMLDIAWPRSYFFGESLDFESVSVYKHEKTETGRYQAIMFDQ